MGKPRKKIRKDGTRVYEIRVTVNKVPYSTTYIPPATWSDNKALKEAVKRTAQLEADARAGLVRNRKQEKEYQAQLAQEQAKRPTFERYTQMYMESRKSTVSANTMENYRTVFERAAPTLNKYLMEEITPAMMREYITGFRNKGVNLKTGGIVKHRTVEKHFKILKTMFKIAAEDDEIIPFSPMQKMKCPKPREDEVKKDPIVYSEKEVQYIYQCLNKEPLKWKALIMFAIDSGCRRGEIVGLKWSEIDFKTGKVNICRNAQYTAKIGTYITTPKNEHNRVVYLNRPVLTVLGEWKKQQTILHLAQGIPMNGFCFTQDNGKMMNPQAPTSYLGRFGKKYNLPGIHPHALRHTMATISVVNGADIVSVSKKLGHANTSITLDIYSHANEEAQRRADEILAQALYTNQKQA